MSTKQYILATCCKVALIAFWEFCVFQTIDNMFDDYDSWQEYKDEKWLENVADND